MVQENTSSAQNSGGLSRTNCLQSSCTHGEPLCTEARHPARRAPRQTPYALASLRQDRPPELIAAIAQLVEQRFCKAQVRGSSPLGGFRDVSRPAPGPSNRGTTSRTSITSRQQRPSHVAQASRPDRAPSPPLPRRSCVRIFLSRGKPRRILGRVPEWTIGADCKSVG